MRVRGRPTVAAVSAALSLVAVYLALVVVVTPTIPSGLALHLAISANWPYLAIITGMVALQAYLYAYSRSLPCRLGRTRVVGTSSSVLASFTSFFGLTSVGCCGLLPLWVSLALGGGAVGTGVSALLVNNSTSLTILGLTVTGVSIILAARNVRSALNKVREALAQTPMVGQTLGEAKS